MIRRPQTPAARAAFERLCRDDVRSDADALVFADWLTEQGSSLGEYLTLTRTGRAREAAVLWERDRLRWLGRLGPFLEPHPEEFRAGLPDLAVLARGFDHQALLSHARATEWLLFRGLRLFTTAADDARLTPLVSSPALKRLRRVEGLSHLLLEALAQRPPPRLDSLHAHAGDASPVELLARFKRLRQLKLHFGPTRTTDSFFACVESLSLERLECAVSLYSLDWDRLAELTLRPRELVLFDHMGFFDAGWDRHMRREKGLKLHFRGAPRPTTVEITVGGKYERALPMQLELLDRVRLRGLSVTVVPARPFSAEERASLRTRLAARASRVRFSDDPP